MGSKQQTAAGAVLVTLCAGQFLMMLDSSVMNVSIATVANDVGTTVTGIQTAITLYTLVMASLMITGGKVGQIMGRKRAFSLGCVIYGCGSFITAISPSLAVLLIGWSCLEGIGAALILPAIVALVASNFGREERPRAYGLVASAAAIAIAVGPIVGGFFTTYLSWRYVFAGEVLVVIVILALARRMADGPRESGVKLDLVGTLLSALGLGLIVFGILRSGTWGFVKAKPGAPEWIGLSPVIWLLLGGGVVLWLFLMWENRVIARGGEPLIDLGSIRNPVLRGGLTAFFFQFFVQGGMFFAVPLFLSVALGLSAIETGVRLLPLSLTLIIAAAGIPRFFPDASPRRVVRIGFGALFVGLADLRRRSRRGRGRGDRHVADADRRRRRRLSRIPARQHHGLLGLRRAQRRGRRTSEHDHEPGHLGGHRADRCDRDRSPHDIVSDRRRTEPGRARVGQIAGDDRVDGRRAVHLRRRTGIRAEEGQCAAAGDGRDH